ncbi:MAG: GIY-YIG nuclease family protein [Bacteroidota bacterium]
MKGSYTVYILKCLDGSFYVGCTSNLEKRLKRHSAGQVISTKRRLPVKLVTHIVFNDKYKAYNFEKYLKSGSGRAFLNKRLI